MKLDGSNYLIWLSQFLPVLKSHDILGIVDGSGLCPPKFLLDDRGKDTSTLKDTSTSGLRPKGAFAIAILRRKNGV